MKNRNVNRKRLLILTAVLAAIMLLSACRANGGDPEKTAYSTATATGRPTASANVTDVPATAVPATEVPPTDAPTEAPTPDNRPLPEPGTMIYYEDFSGYGEVLDTAETVKALGWRILSVGEDAAPSDWTAELSISDGKLNVVNYRENAEEDDPESADGSDSYVMMLDDAYMDRALKTGSYTLQYDVTYTGAKNFKRYIVIVTEYDAEAYNSFHFRIGGYGNNQVHYQNSWFTYDVNDEANLYAAKKKYAEGSDTIAYKLLGITSDLDTKEAKDNFLNVTVTIRIVRENGLPTVFMKTAEMADFVKVSQPSDQANGYGFAGVLKGKAVCLKPGGTINGTVDNIAIWTGTGDMPGDHSVTYEP